MKKSYSTISTTLIALALPVAAVVGLLSNLIIKSNNPSNVDITAGLAYLQPTMIVAIGTFAVLAIAGIIFAFLARKQGEKTVFMQNVGILVSILVLCGVYTLVQRQIDTVEKNYADRQFNTFFESLKEAASKNKEN